jgi:tetratricopeptide (TPR) repeat protein
MVMTTLHQISTWKSSVALWENSLTLYPRNNLVVHFDLGRAYELEGRDGDALRKYEDSLSGNADFFYPLWGKGRILVRQGRLAEGVRDYRQAIYLVPQHPALHAELGSALQRQGKEKEALEELRRALRLDPHFGDGYQALGAYYRRKGQWEGAMACFETAWFLDPDNPVYFKDLMGSYLKAGRPQKALKGYQGLAVDPRSPLSLGLSLNAQEGSW